MECFATKWVVEFCIGLEASSILFVSAQNFLSFFFPLQVIEEHCKSELFWLIEPNYFRIWKKNLCTITMDFDHIVGWKRQLSIIVIQANNAHLKLILIIIILILFLEFIRWALTTQVQ